MALIKKKHVKYALAGAGAIYSVLFVGYGVYAFAFKDATPSGPSEIELHPEREAEIVAQQRAKEMKERLKLSDEQAKQVAEIMQKNQPGGPGGNADDMRNRWRGMHDELSKILTPEQQALADQTRNQMRGNNFTPERVQSIEQNMAPDLKARFDARLQQYQQRRSQRGGRFGGQGPAPTDGAPPEDAPPPDTPAPTDAPAAPSAN